MLPLTASAAVVVNAKVTGTSALAATRSPAAMVNTTPVGCCVDIIKPDGAPAEATVSASVDTVMPVGLPAVAAPIVRPERVMVKAAFAAMPLTAVVMTIELPVMAEVAVMVGTDVLPATLLAGLGEAAKNPAGKFRVIFPLTASAVVVLKARVTGTAALFAKRSPAAMLNVTAVA